MPNVWAGCSNLITLCLLTQFISIDRLHLEPADKISCYCWIAMAGCSFPKQRGLVTQTEGLLHKNLNLQG